MSVMEGGLNEVKGGDCGSAGGRDTSYGTDHPEKDRAVVEMRSRKEEKQLRSNKKSKEQLACKRKTKKVRPNKTKSNQACGVTRGIGRQKQLPLGESNK